MSRLLLCYFITFSQTGKNYRVNKSMKSQTSVVIAEITEKMVL